MPTGNPPAYDTAVGQGGRPNVNVTTPSGDTRSASEIPTGGDLERSRTNETVSSYESDTLSPGLIDEEARKDLDDEQRDLPDGWVRCFDPKTEHHFYVEEATKRAIWIHPYDDPQFVHSLPKEHPAHPDSKEAKAVRKHSQDEEYARKLQEEEYQRSGEQGSTGHATSGSAHNDRNWFQRKKDNMIGTKEERRKAREERRKQKEEQRRRIQAAEDEYIKRRRELIQKQLNDPSIRRHYASDPYGYAPPSMAFSRSGGLYSSPYGYGYGGGYGRRGYGYGGYGGYGYGGYGGMGGMGMGMGLPLMGGLGGGLLLGSALGGGFGGGLGC